MTNIDKNLNNLRIDFGKNGGSELYAIQNSEGLSELFKRRQEILRKINEAKLAAMKKAIEPFEKELNQLQTEYITLLSLSNCKE